MRTILKEINKINSRLSMESRNYVLKISRNSSESEQLKEGASADDALIIMELFNGD